MPLNILQISDLHIGNCYYKPVNKLATSIKVALRNQKKVEVILVSGDIFNYSCLDANKGEDKIKGYIDEAVSFFNILIENLNEINESDLTKEDIIFVPGNHESNKGQIGNGVAKEFKWYIYFLKEFYGTIPYFYDKNSLTAVKAYNSKKIVIAGFNSAFSIESKLFTQIAEEQLADVTDKLNNIPNIDEYVVIAMLHHHFFPIDERYEEDNDSRYLKNSEALLSYLSRYNLSLILHGHKHSTSNKNVIYTPEINEPNKITTVLGCASLGSAEKWNPYNGFNFIRLYEKDNDSDFEYTEYRYYNNRFIKQPTIELPINKEQKIELRLLREFKKLADNTVEDYMRIYNSDTETHKDKLIPMLSNTVGKLDETCKKIYDDKRVILYLFLPMHFRSNVHRSGLFLDALSEVTKKNLIIDGFKEKQIKRIMTLLKSDDLHNMKNCYNELIDDNALDILYDKQKKYIKFMMVSIFLCEQYLVMSEKFKEFFKLRIESKTNLSLLYTDIHNDISGNAVELILDEDRRAIKVSVECRTANAHKVATLIIKEFELQLSNFESDFSSVGFKIYYVTPKFTSVKLGLETLISSYSFEAYMPTLIPLLVGENIYNQPEVFARELIQNSIDAINVRRSAREFDFNEKGKIKISFGEENGENYFEIIDNGTGMNKHNLTRYFTSIGRSFYTSKDFRDLEINYFPISKFGIGMLSCFMVGRRIDVFTKYGINDGDGFEGYKMQIPNYDGCFFIEPDSTLITGTMIRVYEDKGKKNFNKNKIISYIEKTIQNPPSEICIVNRKPIIKNKKIEEIVYDTQKFKMLFPFRLDAMHNNNHKKPVVLKATSLDVNRFFNEVEYRFQNRYGIFIYKKDSALFRKGKITYNASGISSNLSNKFLNNKGIRYFRELTEIYDIYVNLPSEGIDIDVSREFINSIKGINTLAQSIQNDIKVMRSSYINSNLAKKLPYAVLQSTVDERYDFDKLFIIKNQKGYYILSNGGELRSWGVKFNNITQKVFSMLIGDQCILNEVRKLGKESLYYIKDMNYLYTSGMGACMFYGFQFINAFMKKILNSNIELIKREDGIINKTILELEKNMYHYKSRKNVEILRINMKDITAFNSYNSLQKMHNSSIVEEETLDDALYKRGKTERGKYGFYEEAERQNYYDYRKAPANKAESDSFLRNRSMILTYTKIMKDLLGEYFTITNDNCLLLTLTDNNNLEDSFVALFLYLCSRLKPNKESYRALYIEILGNIVPAYIFTLKISSCVFSLNQFEEGILLNLNKFKEKLFDLDEWKSFVNYNNEDINKFL